ncbi:PHD-type domain-containing protein [Favolaschia claudopus]|uniref:PHD-type domain-containing protein n=1 Tax=Favolaschia claudopus TaxID=2862362 RepID=A0AAW0B3I1_9AGAR
MTASCRVCHSDSSGVTNYILTCDRCTRSWHHRCYAPPIPDTSMIEMWQDALRNGTDTLKWSCGRCSSRMKAVAAAAPPQVAIVEEEEIIEIASTPKPRQDRQTMVSETIDLTLSPDDARKPPPRAQVLEEVIDVEFEESRSPSPTPAPAPIEEYYRAQMAELPPAISALTISDTGIIDLSDSPPFVALKLPPSPTGNPLPLALAIEAANATVESHPSPIAGSCPGDVRPSEDLDLNEPMLPSTPPFDGRLPSIDDNLYEDTVDRKPSIFDQEDETEQKPLILLLQKMAVSAPKGGTLGPTWIREGYEYSAKMAQWGRFVDKQKIPKPLSRRKPVKTQFVGDSSREPFVILPFSAN